jgi:hypothetical protein
VFNVRTVGFWAEDGLVVDVDSFALTPSFWPCDCNEGIRVKSRRAKRTTNFGFGNLFRSPVLGEPGSIVYLKI